MDKTIQMAREADLIDDTFASDWYVYQLKAFEALVRADERNRTWTQEHWTDYERSIAAAEREACAVVVEAIEARCVAKDVDDPPLAHVAAAIRARGETK